MAYLSASSQICPTYLNDSDVDEENLVCNVIKEFMEFKTMWFCFFPSLLIFAMPRCFGRDAMKGKSQVTFF